MTVSMCIHNILQNNCMDVVGFAFFIILTMGGTFKEILSLLKIVCCAVIQLLTTIGTIHHAGEQDCFTCLGSALAILTQHLSLLEYILWNVCFVSIIENRVIFYRIVTLFLIPNGNGKGLEVDDTACIFSAFQYFSHCGLMPFTWILRCRLWSI